jgi:hypothetical protein
MNMNHSQEKEKQKITITTTTATRITQSSFAMLTAALVVLSSIAAAQLLVTNNNAAYATTNDRRAISEIIPIEEQTVDTTFCENGEEIQISGNAHVVSRIVEDEPGEFKLVGHVNFQNVEGVGLTTGNDYRFPYATNVHYDISLEGKGTVTDLLAVGHLISEGSTESAPNLLVHALFHATFNANGQITAWIDNFSAECR